MYLMLMHTDWKIDTHNVSWSQCQIFGRLKQVIAIIYLQQMMAYLVTASTEVINFCQM